MNAPRIIAIDGPSAAGKGTLARRLAAHFNLPYLDTGLLYRATGRLVLDAGADPADPDAALAAAKRLRPADLDRADLRGPAADDAASLVAAQAPVRAALLDYQRRFGAEHGAVLDGRDIGTVVFPDADVKLFVTASQAERAHRRWREFQARGMDRPLAEVESEMVARDERDTQRLAAPAKQAPDAILLDTTGRDADAAFAAALALIARAMLATLARRWMRFWQGAGLDGFEALHAPDFRDESAGGRGAGRDAFRASVAALYAAFPDFRATTEDLVIDQEPDAGGCARVAVRWTATGTHSGPFGALPPTRRLITFRGIEILAIRDGLVRRRWGEWDADDLRRQLTEKGPP